MDSSNCLFCKLKSVKENILFENDKCYVIVDRFPYSNRHLLIIIKDHYKTLGEVEDNLLSEVFLTAKKLALKLKFEKYNLVQNNVNGQLVPHMHCHLIGCNETGGLGNNEILTLSDDEYSNIVKEIKALLN
jgi:histidine triad (HIT) family protein